MPEISEYCILSLQPPLVNRHRQVTIDIPKENNLIGPYHTILEANYQVHYNNLKKNFINFHKNNNKFQEMASVVRA